MNPHLPARPYRLALLLALLFSTACATTPDANDDAASDDNQGKITVNEDPELRDIAQRSLEFHKPALQTCFQSWLETIDEADYIENTSLMFTFHLQLDARNNRTGLIYKSWDRDGTRHIQKCMETYLKQRLVNAPDATPTSYIPLAIKVEGFGTTDLREARANTVVTYGTKPDRNDSSETGNLQ